MYSYFNNHVDGKGLFLFEESEQTTWFSRTIFDLLVELKRKFALQSDASLIVPALNLKFPINMSYTKLITLGQLWALHESLFGPNPFYTKIEVDSTNFEIRLEELLNISKNIKESSSNNVFSEEKKDQFDFDDSSTIQSLSLTDNPDFDCSSIDPSTLIESDCDIEDDFLPDDQYSIKTCDSNLTNQSVAWSLTVNVGEINSASSFVNDNLEVHNESFLIDSSVSECSSSSDKKRSTEDMSLEYGDQEDSCDSSSKRQKSDEEAI